MLLTIDLFQYLMIFNSISDTNWAEVFNSAVTGLQFVGRGVAVVTQISSE